MTPEDTLPPPLGRARYHLQSVRLTIGGKEIAGAFKAMSYAADVPSSAPVSPTPWEWTGTIKILPQKSAARPRGVSRRAWWSAPREQRRRCPPLCWMEWP
jgi:hypothetical protein